jgi:hypothetical protein
VTGEEGRNGPGPWRPAVETRRSGIGIWLGLFTAVLLLLQPGAPPPLTIACLIGMTCLLMAALRWRLGIVAVIALLVVGVAMRVTMAQTGSDVLTVTRAAIELVLAGGNPYGHGYRQSSPPGAPFAYGPLALIWYLPSRTDPVRVELLVSFVLLAVLAVRGRVLGLAVYATLPPLILLAGDGSNDTSAGLIILVALLLAERSPWVGAIALAVASAFKLYALAWVPPLLVYGGLTTLVPFVAGMLLAWGPALILWDPRKILTSLRNAEAIHTAPYYSLAVPIAERFDVPRDAYNVVRFTAGGLLAMSSWLFVRSSRSFIGVGIAVFLATLFLGWWSTFAYFAAIAPVICWHLDDWLGLPRVIWPSDPVGRLTALVDLNWPVRGPVPAVSLQGTDVSSAAQPRPQRTARLRAHQEIDHDR